MFAAPVPSSALRLIFRFFFVVSFIVPASAQVQQTFSDVHHDVSPALRDLAKTSSQPGTNAQVGEMEEVKRIPLPPGLKPAGEPDSVLQHTTPAALATVAPTAGLNFEGLGEGIPGFFIVGAPPDTNGAVGLTQYVQWVNTSFAVFDKSTGNMLLGPLAGNTLWQGFGGGCEANNDGDPIVLYDKLADRWVFSQFSVRGSNSGPFLQCVAVSTTSDATSTYNRYSFTYSQFDDYPKMGVWPDAYYVTFNMFAPPNLNFVGADACAYDRNAMLNGQPATQICFQQGPSIGGLLPSDVDGHTPPPAGSPNYMLFFGSNSLELFKFHVDFTTPANSTFTGPTIIPVAPFTTLCNGARACVAQPGTTTQLDSLGDRLMYRLAYRNFGDHESLVVNHSVAAPSGGGVRWYEIQNPNGTPTVAQQSTFAPDSAFRWMGSIAMDQIGDMALGYSVSSSTVFPSIAFTARAASDPVSTMQAETTIFSGTGSQTTFFNGTPLTRWGDYSAMQVDPSDDCTFWYTTEYLSTTGAFNWHTRIASFKFSACEKPDLTITATHAADFTQGQTGAAYTLTVTNSGGVDTNADVTVTDTLPAGLTASAMSGTGWNCVLGTLTCTRSDVLSPGASYPAITLTVDVANNAAGVVKNSASVSGGGEVDTQNDVVTDSTTVIQLGPDPTVSKTHTGDFIQGQTGTYTITVTNVGLSPLDTSQVTVTDTLPAGLTASTISGTGWSCVTGPPVTCTRSDALASNSSYPPISLTVNVASSAGPLVVNSVTVSGGGDTNTLNNAATDSTRITPPPSDLTITKSHTGNFQQGQFNAAYTVTISNSGQGPTSGTVTVVDTLPTGLTLQNMFGAGWLCNQSTARCTRSDVLGVNLSYPPITVNVNVASNAPASVTNTAAVSGGGETNTANDTASDPTTITPTPDLTIIKSHMGDFTVGQSGTYTITVGNNGAGPTVGQVNVIDFIPFGMTATANSGTGWTCGLVPASFVNCQRNDVLDTGSSYPPITITVRVDGVFSSVVTNTAQVSGGGELNTANDFASDPTNVLAPALAITKTHAPATFIVGGTGTYTITASNTGTSSTVGTITMADSMPQGMTVTAINATGWSCSTPPTAFVNCTRSDALASGDSFPAISLTVQVSGAVASVVINNASLAGGGDLNFHNVSDPTPVTAPTLGITKSHTGDFTVGKTGDYTITVSNSGTIPTQGTVTVTDFLPFGMTATAFNATGWTCPSSSTFFVTCTRSDVLATGSSYPPIVMTVSIDASISASVLNTANVTGGGDLGSHSASDLTSINLPDLAVTMSHNGNFVAGQSLAAYTVTVKNVGNVATAGGTLSVNDFLPTALTPTAAGGAGWTCNIFFGSVNCSRAAATLAPGDSYPTLQITVSVAPDAPPNVTNSVSIGGIGDANFTNNNSSDPTIIDRIGLNPNSSTNGTVTAGNAATFVFTAFLAATPSVGTVTFSVTGLPPNSKADFTPPTVTQSGPVAITINTSGNGHVASIYPTGFGPSRWMVFAFLVPFMGYIGIATARRKGRKSWLFRLAYISCLAILFVTAGCGGGGSPAPNPTPVPTPAPIVTPPGTYTMTMTATSSNPGVAPASIKVTLVVQ